MELKRLNKELQQKDDEIEKYEGGALVSGFVSYFSSSLAIFSYLKRPRLQELYDIAAENLGNYWNKLSEITDPTLKELYKNHVREEFRFAYDALHSNDIVTTISATIAIGTFLFCVFFSYLYFSERKERRRQKTIDQYS